MGRYIRWQAILVLTGSALMIAFLSFLAVSRTTVSIPDAGGVYVEGITGSPQFINPLLSQYNQVDQDLSSLIFNGLTQMDGNGNLEPDLAQSWDIGNDFQTYTFKLRSDVRWHDGQAFTADDVVFTVSLMQDPEFPGLPSLRQLWQNVTVEKLDNTTIQFNLSEPFPAFIEFTQIGILPEHALTGLVARDMLNNSFNLNPIGTGPFKLDSINAERAVLSRNPFYLGKTPLLAGLEFRFYDDTATIIDEYGSGAIQGVGLIPPTVITDVRSIDSLNLYSARLSGYDIVYLNLQDPDTVPFFQDVNVRRALLQGLDRQALIDRTLNGQGLVADGPIPFWSWAYNPEQPLVTPNVFSATLLLEDGGWFDRDRDGIREKDNTKLAFTLLTSDVPEMIAVANDLSGQWADIGVDVTVEVVESGLGDRLVQHQFQAALAEVLTVGDPDPYPLWHQTQIDGGQNYGRWDNSEASMLLEGARTLQDRGQRNDYYFEFQRIFAEEVPSLVLFHPIYTYGVSQDIYGVQVAPMKDPSDRFQTIANWYALTREIIYDEPGF